MSEEKNVVARAGDWRPEFVFHAPGSKQKLELPDLQARIVHARLCPTGRVERAGSTPILKAALVAWEWMWERRGREAEPLLYTIVSRDGSPAYGELSATASSDLLFVFEHFVFEAAKTGANTISWGPLSVSKPEAA